MLSSRRTSRTHTATTIIVLPLSTVPGTVTVIRPPPGEPKPASRLPRTSSGVIRSGNSGSSTPTVQLPPDPGPTVTSAGDGSALAGSGSAPS